MTEIDQDKAEKLSPIPRNVEIAGKSTLRLAIGTARIGSEKVGNKLVPVLDRDEEYVQILQDSFSLGLTHIDSARMYGEGHTSEIVGQAIAGLDRERFVIASKVGAKPVSREQVLFDVEAEVKAIGGSYLDVVYVHDQWHGEGEMGEPMKECLAGLCDAVDRGLAKSIGVSNFTLEQLQNAMAHTRYPITIIQSRFNVLSHPLISTELLDFCRKNKILVAAHTSLGRGDIYNSSASETLATMAEKYGVSPAVIALNWLLSQEGVIPVVRSHKKDHIADNLRAFDFAMSKSDWETLNGLAKTEL